ncbi:MFS transporter [[Pseudomonas] boreopolis]|uniref:MFS transporter n=1 Tax=Xanthomonas boreopolis TaxID=86183 RepID=UPI003D5BD469
MSSTPLPQACPGPAADSVMAAPYRAATSGMVALVSLGAFEALAVATAMPTVARELDGLRLYAMAFGGMLAASVVGMTLAGRSGDRHGPARPLWSGLATFLCGLLLAGLAPSMPWLIAGRVLQGLGAGAMSVALYVLVGRLYPPELQPRVFSAFSAGWVLPSLVGPALAGLIVQHAGWRWIFLGVPAIAIPAAALLYRPLAKLPPAPHRDAGTPPLWPWATGAAVGVLAMYVGGQSRGGGALAAMAIAALVLLACVYRLLPAGTLRAARGLPSVVLLRGLAPAAFFGCEAFVPLLLSRERGLSPALAGIALSVGAFSWFCGSWYQGHYAGSRPRQRLIALGAATLAAGIGLTALAIHPAVPVAVAVAGWGLAGAGMGLVYPSLSVLVLQLSPPGTEGRNSSALQLCEAVAVATMLAVGGSLFAMMLDQRPRLGYLLAFGLALALALLAGALAGRTRAR